MRKRLLALAVLFGMCGLTTICHAATEPCDSMKVPPAVSALLEKSFPHWRVEKPSDLDPFYQQVWTKNFSATCPGFVSGHLQEPDAMAYAFLLVHN
jgi:hypothetical protein